MPEAPRRSSCFGLGLLLVSLGCNLLVFLTCLVSWWLIPKGDPPLEETHIAGAKTATDKIAVIHLEGVILEGMLGFVEEQIEQAAEDKEVKAVVLRINSPGGSITASDQLHRRLEQLRDGVPDKKTSAKPLVVSMASMAASGGYYVAMPAKVLYAERTSVTGSIGVYASFPNASGLAEKVGFDMSVVKRGDVKTAGSPLRDMRPEEREMWQSMVDHAYDQFKAVVEQGRPALKDKLEEKILDEKRSVMVEKKDGSRSESVVHYVRRRADGGIYTADEALRFGLIDKIGYLEDAIKEAHTLAGLGESYRAIEYRKPFSLSDTLLGVRVQQQVPTITQLAEGLTPRLWYLSPQSEFAGILAASRIPEKGR